MTDTDPREPQPIGAEQWPAPVVEAPQLPSPPADQNADLVEMLCAAEPSLDAEWFEGSVKEQHPITLWPNGLQRILAWANARRDAAVEATKNRNISNADLVARLKHHAEWSADPNELRAAEFEETAEIIALLPEIITVLSVLHETPDPRDAQIARLREALEDISKQKLTEEIDADDARWGDYEGAYNTIIGVARAALSDTEARDA